jgi:hypothetical protein
MDFGPDDIIPMMQLMKKFQDMITISTNTWLKMICLMRL